MRLRFMRLGLMLLVGSIFSCPLALGQSAPAIGSSAIQQQLIQQAQRQAAQRAMGSGSLALEGAVDPDEYSVGPGDEFLITTGGGLAQEIRATVSAEGTLLVPEAGQFMVAGRVLTDVTGEINRSLRRLYRNVPVEVALVQPRQFFVHVTGAVRQPGRHIVGPVARVEDAILAAMDGDSPVLAFRQDHALIDRGGVNASLPALRNVRVINRDGTETLIDLRRYYSMGDRRNNPYLRDGDVVHVPAFDLRRQAVFVEGAVLSPGPYDLRDDDSAGTVLQAAVGSEDLSKVGSVRVVAADRQTAVTFDLGAGSDRLFAHRLASGDRLIVQRGSPTMGTASVVGRAAFPGMYPIVVGQTTVETLLDQAGGIREGALQQAAFIERRPSGEERTPRHDRFDSALRDPALALSGGQSLSALELELLLEEEAFATVRLADLEFVDRQYLLRELRRAPRIPIDLNGGEALSMVLQDGDRLVIPHDPGGIYVFGQVANSGFIPFAPGQGAAYYVDRAGGATSGATSVFVRRVGTGLVTPASDIAMIQQGDQVFVNRRPMADSEVSHGLLMQEQQLSLQERQLRSQNRSQWIQVGAAMLSAGTAIVTAIIFSRN